MDHNIPVDEIRLAKLHLTEWQPPENNPRPILVMSVPEKDKRSQEGNQEFIVWGSVSDPNFITGRATRGYPALEKKKEKVGFLKDTWRAECVRPESDILELLQGENVPNIPPFLCGDLLLPTHQTLTGQYARSAGAEGDGKRKVNWRCGRNFQRVTSRIHHRFVVDFVGKKLIQCKSSKQLLRVVLDAFIAHQEAYEKCYVLHRDVSINNIMISRDGKRGVLIDWDLAIILKDNTPKPPREYERTGTWQFMSAMLLKYPDKIHTIQDDMESFIHVVLYIALRYLPHNKEDKLLSIIRQVFDFYYFEEGIDVGGRGKKVMIVGRDHIEPDFRFMNNGPLNLWLDLMLDAAKEWIEYSESTTTMEPRSMADPGQAALMAFRNEVGRPNRTRAAKPMPTFFSSHSKIRDTWTALLERQDFIWPENDWKQDALRKFRGLTPLNNLQTPSCFR